ncbi:hypothetical protein MD484_g5627, partial [Candolleomyces efflorescens]
MWADAYSTGTSLKITSSSLDAKIQVEIKALAACGGCLYLIGVVVANSHIASLTSERNDKANQLQVKQSTLEEVNSRQEVLANLQSDFHGVKPDIALVCAKHGLLAEIWPSIRSQAEFFKEHLQEGMDVITNQQFQNEVSLARKMCAPLEAGLEKYATELDSYNN